MRLIFVICSSESDLLCLDAKGLVLLQRLGLRVARQPHFLADALTTLARACLERPPFASVAEARPLIPCSFFPPRQNADQGRDTPSPKGISGLHCTTVNRILRRASYFNPYATPMSFLLHNSAAAPASIVAYLNVAVT